MVRKKDAPQSVAGWPGFCNVAQSDQILRPSNIEYLPVIPSSPTQLPTVYILMVRSLATVDKLSQHDVVIHLKNRFIKGTKAFFFSFFLSFFLFLLKRQDFRSICETLLQDKCDSSKKVYCNFTNFQCSLIFGIFSMSALIPKLNLR